MTDHPSEPTGVDRAATPGPRLDSGSWIGVAALLGAIAVIASLVLDSSMIGWLIFVAVLVAVAVVVAVAIRPRVAARSGAWLAFAGYLVVPAVVGYFAWRAETTAMQWGLRYLIAVVIGAVAGALVGSGTWAQSGDLRPRNGFWQFLHSYRQGADTMAGVLGFISAALVFPTVIISVVNVVLRRVGAAQGRNLTTNGLIEAQWYLYGLIFVCGLAYILRDGINVRVDFWFGERSPKTQSWIDIVGHCIGLLPLAYIGIKYSWPSVEISWANQERSPDAGGLYRPPIKTALLLGFVFLGIQGFADLIKNIEFVRGHELRQGIEAPAMAAGQSYELEEFDIDPNVTVGAADEGAIR